MIFGLYYKPKAYKQMTTLKERTFFFSAHLLGAAMSGEMLADKEIVQRFLKFNS
jgi:hypothetical protein